MVAEDTVGKQGDSPLVVQPKIAGKWKWLSTQSGVFTPTEAPALGGTFQLGLRGDLKDAAGKAVKGPFRETLQTPAFRVKGWVANPYINHDNASPVP